MWVAEENDVEMISRLMETNADINETNNDGFSAFILAFEQGHDEIVQDLIQAKADVNVKDKNGDTALITASTRGNKEGRDMRKEGM